MIQETFKDVMGVEHKVIITPEWDVTFDKDQHKRFTSPVGPLIVATIVSNFDSFTEKTDIKQLSLETYLELLERGYRVFDPSPTEYSQKELGDKFDAFIRKRDLPLRQNVYHIGKLAFRKIVFVRDPTNLHIAEELFERAAPDNVEEEGRLAIIDSYNVSFLERRNKHARGFEQPKSSASEQTLDKLSRGLVDVSTRATRRNSSHLNQESTLQIKDVGSNEVSDTTNTKPDVVFPQIVEYSNVTEYGEIAYQHLEALSVGREISEFDMKKFLEGRGFIARTEDVSNILIFATRNQLGTLRDSQRVTEGEISSITFVKN